MASVLAALDASAVSGPVLAAAVAFADLTGASVNAVHVRPAGRPDDETLAFRRTAERYPVRVQTFDGPVEETLLAAIEDPEVIAAVLGARRTPTGQRPAGHIAMRMLTDADKPILIVPPEVTIAAGSGLTRVLVPLDGDRSSSAPVLDVLGRLFVRDVDIIVLHVFTGDTAPRFLDHPVRDLSLWADEFVARHCPPAGHIRVHTGSVVANVLDVASDEVCDLVVLSWSRNMTDGHATIIRDVLSRSTVPVLLLPVDPSGGTARAT